MNKILIVVDMQNDFIDGSLGSEQAQRIVDNVVNKINNFNGRIFVTHDIHYDDYLDTHEGKHLPIKHCIVNTHGFRLNEKISNVINKKDENTILKIYKQSFGSPYLVNSYSDVIVNDNNTEITLVGLCTDICVVSNALLLKSFFPEANIIVDASCCAGTTIENHNAALLTMQNCQIEVINWEVQQRTRPIDADNLINIVKKWYWDKEKQNVDPMYADLWIDLFIRTIKECPTLNIKE